MTSIEWQRGMQPIGRKIRERLNGYFKMIRGFSFRRGRYASLTRFHSVRMMNKLKTRLELIAEGFTPFVDLFRRLSAEPDYALETLRCGMHEKR